MSLATPSVPYSATQPDRIWFTERLPVGIQFTEQMTGHFSWTNTASYEDAAASGEREGRTFECILTIVADDLERMLNHWRHPAGLVGTVEAHELSNLPMTVTEGKFNFFVVNPNRIDSRQLRYRMRLTADAGRVYYVEGFKEVRRSFHAWSQLTTLYITIYDSTQAKRGAVLGRGILRLSLDDFLRQLTTIRVRHARSFTERLDAITRFVSFFAGVVRKTYGHVLAPWSISTPDAPPRARRPVRRGIEHMVPTRDGSMVMLTRYEGGAKGPVILVPGFGARASSFATDTVKKNLVEYLCEHKYDVWLFDYRASPDFLPAGPSFTIDDIARNDYPAALSKVLLERTDKKDLQILAHCVGSMSLLMSLLAGALRRNDGTCMVRSVICSQLATHPETVLLNELKAGLLLGHFLRWLGVKSANADFNPRDWRHRVADRLLKFLPSKERCNNPHCRRILFIFGESYKHDQLNVATHDAIDEWFGTTSMRALAHLSLMLRRDQIVDKDGNDVYLGNPEGLSRLAIPISFMHGRENREFVPRATEITYDLLCKANGAHLYRREVFDHYAHMDCFIGRNAHRDKIFRWIVAELDRFN